MTKRPEMVTLPTGLVVERRGVWLWQSCPDNDTRHTPSPTGYGGMEVVDDLRIAAGQRQVKCPTCGLLAVWVGGRSVRGWPKRPRKSSPKSHKGA